MAAEQGAVEFLAWLLNEFGRPSEERLSTSWRAIHSNRRFRPAPAEGPEWLLLASAGNAQGVRVGSKAERPLGGGRLTSAPLLSRELSRPAD